MIRAGTEVEAMGPDINLRHAIKSPPHTEPIIRVIIILSATIAVAVAPLSATAQAKKPRLPYVTIDHPQFISALQATFLSPKDLLIGVTDGKAAKAYPVAILAQHGVVQDGMADGPIAVTW